MAAQLEERPPAFPWLDYADESGAHRAGFLSAWPRMFMQGEHVVTVGPTGSGKTTLMLELVQARERVVALATKPKDATMERLVRRDGWKKVKRWRAPNEGRWVLWPNIGRLSDLAGQQRAIYRCIDDIYTAGGFTIFADELYYLCKTLGLSRPMEMLWTQGRSNHVTIMGGTQRPTWVPHECWANSTHFFLFRTGHEADLAKVGSFNGANAKLIAAVVETLDDHEFLYTNTRTGRMVRSMVRAAVPVTKGHRS